MHDGVEPCLNEDENAEELVDVDVVVERQEPAEAQLPKLRDGVTMNQE